ncbi:MAG: MBL fold metallo-hydrolase [Bacteroidetes bacterium HGW-Bacteroidetes-21]|jgi:flavorubredoxin|nr:MAG: MBL fold metallo-hydrolase [Bacteroidetes bacterium HGW-Bacteroidetes-21]
MADNRILDVTPDVKWIGILDKDIVTFDIVMETKYGTTYNSYIINADKKAIVETAKEKFWPEYEAKIRQVVNPEEIEYIIMDHTEPDHSGSLPHLLKIAPQATVVGSGNALRYLSDMVGFEFKSMQVKDGDTLSLGNKTLRFIAAPNLHWPDSIYTYLEEDKVLFTCDSFGAHFCNDEMYDDKVGNYDEAFKYYFDVILKPFSKFMLKAIEKIRPLDIAVICTGHGPILRSSWKRIVDMSEIYAKAYLAKTDSAEKSVLITYVSAYGYTREMAEEIAKGIHEAGINKVTLLDIENIALGDLDAALTLHNAILVGCPTLNQNILLPIYKMFALINPLRDRGKLAASFGSYGWSGEGVKIIDAVLTNLKLKVFHEGMADKFRPSEAKSGKLIAFGRDFGKAYIDYNCNPS